MPGPLAYVFWHAPAPGHSWAGYHDDLRTFHTALATDPPDGLLHTRTARVPPLRWLAGGGFEDWYVVSGFAALGALNAAAVDARRRAAHDRAAARAGPAAGGVYALVTGDAGAAGTRQRWLDKPAGTSYARMADLVAAVRPAAVWQRQLVLGPAPEWCLVDPADDGPGLDVELGGSAARGR